MMWKTVARSIVCVWLAAGAGMAGGQEPPPVIAVEGQPLAAAAARLALALESYGAPLETATAEALDAAIRERDGTAIQRILDPHALLIVTINPESRVKVERGPAEAVLQQAGFTPVLIKVVNESTVTKRLRLVSPQAGPVYAGVAELSMRRQQQPELRVNENREGSGERFLHLEMATDPPMTDQLSGLEVEYVLAFMHSSEAGRREATVGCDIGQGNQDLGFRGEVPILFDVRPAVPLRLHILDDDGAPTVARLEFRDAQQRVYPPQPKRLAPDLFFQSQVYRADGETVWLPPGPITVTYDRGPEYRRLQRDLVVSEDATADLELRLERWIDPSEFGFYSGDHHIHAAGCAHYTFPTQGIAPEDMFRQVKGEGLNVGCVLTWGPCFEHQRQYFEPAALDLSDARTLLKYDLEISGFGSQALGHVCLLNLRDQTYPGTEGTTEGWPTWATPVMRWAREQGGITGYAHSASGLQIDPESSARWLLARADRDGDGRLTAREAEQILLPRPFASLDADGDRRLSPAELRYGIDGTADELPNLAIPEMNGVGAMEICVSVVEGVCDFISAMDTPRIQEWNCWYHLLNCGFPLKVSGETDFPCMSGQRVGQGRVYVQLGDVDRLEFAAWCSGLAQGRSYVSDGFAHALDFRVDGVAPGFGDVRLDGAGRLPVTARVAFAPSQPRSVAHGNRLAIRGRRVWGDTVLMHGEPTEARQEGGHRVVELIVNGSVRERAVVPADGRIHELAFQVEVDQSSWIALRQFPQLHTNPVTVLVGDRPIRASRESALWCALMTERLWENRHNRIAPNERDDAARAFARAIDTFRRLADERP